MRMDKEAKIFISHSSKDEKYAKTLVELLEKIGISSEFVFCTSVPQHDVALTKNFIEHIKEEFRKYDLKMIYLLSKNFYDSPVSLNEMGAAWISEFDYFLILLHRFDFSDIAGVVDSKKIALKLDEEKERVQYRLDEFKNNMCMIFKLNEPDNWQEIRENFLEKMEKIKIETGRRQTVIMPSPL